MALARLARSPSVLFISLLSVIVIGAYFYFHSAPGSRSDTISVGKPWQKSIHFPKSSDDIASNDIDSVPSSNVGYVMAMHYVDQLTGSSANVLNLQCFVGRYLPNVKVVEPFVLSDGTILGVSLSSTFHILNDRRPEEANKVKLGDLFDLDKWTTPSEAKYYAPFVSWNDFMNNHPTEVILVHHTWTHDECNPLEMRNATKEFIAETDFEVVRQVCLNFRKTGVLSPQELIDMIYGTSYKPTNAVVIFYYWGGIVSNVQGYRFSIKDTSCNRANDVRLTHHSKRISNDVKEYTSKYMSSSRYIAVMIRFEHYGINRRLSKMSSDTQRRTLMECFKTISSKVESLKREKNIKDTLLAMDFSRQGSCALWGKDNPYLDVNVLNQTVPTLFELLFGQSFKQDRWEKSFSDVADFQAPGYVGVLQKTLAASADCLIVVGGGSFQGSTVTLHNEMHPGTQCVLNLC